MSRSAKSPPSQEGAARNGWARPAGESILNQAQSAFARAGFADASLLLHWSSIAGPQIARLARPAKWQDGPEGAVLTLTCEAGAIVFLQHQTRELTERLNTYLGRGRIHRLRLVAGRLEQSAEPQAHPAQSAEDWPKTMPLSDALQRLGKRRAERVRKA
jgi:hypothetical protein